MSEAADDKRTVGEELFLVHLSRYNATGPSGEDFDHEEKEPEPRERSMSVGEELWRVHCKRNQGVESEEDKSEDEVPAKKAKVTKGTPPRKKTSSRTINLRNRVVKAKV